MTRHRQVLDGGGRIVRREPTSRLPAAPGLVTLDDHARLPWRFHGRFTASTAAGLGRA